MGRSEMELKTWAMGRPSSFSIISNACIVTQTHSLQHVYMQLMMMKPNPQQHDMALKAWVMKSRC